MTTDPLDLFRLWFAQAEKTEISDPNAMALATTGPDLKPSVRMVLLKDYNATGFTFFSNSHSKKGQQLAKNQQAALCFYWKSLKRQVRVEGEITVIPTAASNAYFATRDRQSQIGAWASQQSEVMITREAFLDQVRKIEAKYQGQNIPRPPHWVGYLLRPRSIEFWEEQPYRLHDRTLYEKVDGGWKTVKLYP